MRMTPFFSRHTAEVLAYMGRIGSKGGSAGHGAAKARTTAQARAAANVRWAEEKRRSSEALAKALAYIAAVHA